MSVFRVRKILCPVDFFPASMRAFKCALGLAAKYKAGVHVLHVIPPVITAAYGSMITASDITLDLERESRLRLGKLKAEGQAAKVRVTTETSMGDVDSQVRRAIKLKRPDLVIMGTHGRRGFQRWVIGSVTERMIRHCPVPLLVIGAHGSGPVASFGFDRILVAVDFSEGTSAALANAFAVAKEHAAWVTLLHVVNDIAADVSGKYREPLLRGVEQRLSDLIPKSGVNRRRVEVRTAAGSPYRIIPKVLKEGKHDLLIMNIHGKTLVERALIGSTAERVVRAVSSSCPLLLIPPATKEKRAPQGTRHGRVKKA